MDKIIENEKFEEDPIVLYDNPLVNISVFKDVNCENFSDNKNISFSVDHRSIIVSGVGSSTSSSFVNSIEWVSRNNLVLFFDSPSMFSTRDRRFFTTVLFFEKPISENVRIYQKEMTIVERYKETEKQ